MFKKEINLKLPQNSDIDSPENVIMDVIEETHDMTEKHQEFNVPDLLVFQCFDDLFQFLEKLQESEYFPCLAH